VVICLERGADLHTAQLMPLPLTVSCSSKSRLVLPLWYRLTRVVSDKRPLNGRVCVSVCLSVCLPVSLSRPITLCFNVQSPESCSAAAVTSQGSAVAVARVENECVPKIRMNDTINLFFVKLQSAVANFKPVTVSRVLLL